MKLQTQRWIDRWAGQTLCALMSLWARFFSIGTTAAMPEAPRHILVILLSEMGSVVLAGPMFSALRKRYPSATIHVLQLKKNQEVAKLLGLARPAHLHAIDDSAGLLGLFKDIWRVSRALRRLPLDAVIDCELFSRISSLMGYFSGARLRVGFTPHTQEGLYRGSFINRAIPYNPYQHISKQFLSLADALEGQGMPRSKDAPIRGIPADAGLAVPFEAAELSAYQQKLHLDHPTLASRQVVLLYAGGGLLPERAWPASYYAEIARGLCAAGHAVGLIGLRDDAVLASDLCQQVSHASCVDLTGYTRSIRELLMLFHAARLLITNDGGPGHFASLTPIRTMVFFGPETGRLYGPLGSRAQVLESGIACSPCLSAYNHRLTFCDGDNQCLKRIRPEPVLRDALDHLNQNLQS
jgi:ADP-heptose:LPS heptosyltransferase